MVTTELRTFLGMPAIIVSPAMQRLMQLVERVAMTPAAVLIQGESGSGKELVARAIHSSSMRSGKPWVDVSCAALPDLLIESELFGYEKGAFSGADSNKPGLFELAHHGTLFLDEIGELEPKMQVKLLRVLDGTPYYRLGGVRKISVDVRVLAATNQNLETAIESGRFRADLYHRISQISLTVPPLRERIEDVLPLARYFLEQTNPRLLLARCAMDKLERYSWPGNVRELRNAIIKASVMTDAAEIRACDLALGNGRNSSSAPAGATSDLENLQRRMIFQVLAETGGHHQRAADLLGISRRTLSRKLKLYGAGAESKYAAQTAD